MTTSSHIQFLRLPDVAKRLAIGKSTVYSLIAKGQFPQGVKITGKTIAWPVHVVDAWSAERIANSQQ